MHKVFVSYSSREADRANEIVKQLEAAGIPCWIAHRDIHPGSNYTTDIPKAIRECTHFLLALSASAEESVWVNKELATAIKRQKTILPLMIENFTISEGFEFLLEDVQIRNYCNNCQGVLREVISLFPNAAPTVPAHAPAHTPAPTPTHAPAAPAPDPVQNEMTAEEYCQKGINAYNSQQYEDAVGWLRKAADQGHAIAQNRLGYCYNMGHGVDKNLVEAVKWYEKAADQGYANAQYNLGLCYNLGDGVDKDPVEAVKWYRKAADQGHARAQCNLGVCYSRGEGEARDKIEAVKWYRKAAEQGHSNAQYDLGNCYRYGWGVAVDLAEAKKWYQKAADQGDAAAKIRLSRLK